MYQMVIAHRIEHHATLIVTPLCQLLPYKWAESDMVRRYLAFVLTIAWLAAERLPEMCDNKQ